MLGGGHMEAPGKSGLFFLQMLIIICLFLCVIDVVDKASVGSY